MRSPVEEPIDAVFEVRRTSPPDTALHRAMARLAVGVAVVVVICIFATICAGAALAAALLSAS